MLFRVVGDSMPDETPGMPTLCTNIHICLHIFEHGRKLVPQEETHMQNPTPTYPRNLEL